MSHSPGIYCVSDRRLLFKNLKLIARSADISFREWLKDGFGNQEKRVGIDLREVGKETNCRTREYSMLSAMWTTPTDLDEKEIYQFRMRTLGLETISEPFRLESSIESLLKIEGLQRKGLALASESRDRHQSFLRIEALEEGLVLLAWGAAYVYYVRGKRAASRRTKAVDSAPPHNDAVYADVEE